KADGQNSRRVRRRRAARPRSGNRGVKKGRRPDADPGDPETHTRRSPSQARGLRGVPRGAAQRAPPQAMTADFAALLRALAAGGVESILVGGVAAAGHGAARATYDVDGLYARTPENIPR